MLRRRTFFAGLEPDGPNFYAIIEVFAAQRRAISSGVEHCIHTAGVASSKLASPTKNSPYKKAPHVNVRCFFFVQSRAFGGDYFSSLFRCHVIDVAVVEPPHVNL